MDNSRILKIRIKKIANILATMYPDACCELTFSNPLECLISTILSAQCTDVKVNQVTPKLFSTYRDVYAFSEANLEELESIIRSIGLFRMKSKNIILCCQKLISDFSGEVPKDMDSLITLPGVGRKTANCVLINAYHQPGIMCDTHCCRVTHRLGLHNLSDPEKIEYILKSILPIDYWADFSHRVIIHGRRCCKARNPVCSNCLLVKYCSFFSS